jgi:alpha-1,3-mannosyltransferase
MAQPAPPLHAQALQFVIDVSTGRHALSKLIAPALWLADAALCALIIWKIPCKLPRKKPQACAYQL